MVEKGFVSEGHVSDLVGVSPAEFATLTHELSARLRGTPEWKKFWDQHVLKGESRLSAARVMIATMLMVQMGAIMSPEAGK